MLVAGGMGAMGLLFDAAEALRSVPGEWLAGAAGLESEMGA